MTVDGSDTSVLHATNRGRFEVTDPDVSVKTGDSQDGQTLNPAYPTVFGFGYTRTPPEPAP
jgi:hypothetical protein